MAKRKPREIPFDQYIKPIVDDPASMGLRLDFADWIGKNGDSERAQWFRQVCARCEQERPLTESFPAHGIILPDHVLPPESPDISVEHYLRARWLEIRPSYWQELEGVHKRLGVRMVWHFGRASILAGAYPDNHYPLLGATSEYVSAFRDGWLEAMYCDLFHANQVESLLAWPESHRDLPLHANTLQCQAEGFTDQLMKGILSLPGLQGITLAPEEIAFPCMKRFSELACNLRYLSIVNLRKTGPCRRILEQLRHLPELRVLMVGRNLPTDDEMKNLAAIPKLQSLHLGGLNVTDQGLRAIADIRTLRAVRVNTPRVTRAGIYALREARPDLRVVAVDDTLEMLGPV